MSRVSNNFVLDASLLQPWQQFARASSCGPEFDTIEGMDSRMLPLERQLACPAWGQYHNPPDLGANSYQHQLIPDVMTQWRNSSSRTEAVRLLRILLSNMPQGGSPSTSGHVASAMGRAAVVGPKPCVSRGHLCRGLASRSKLSTTIDSNSEHTVESPRSGITTLMLRGIPGCFSLSRLVELWPVDGTWDLLYLPLRGNGGKARGYAFMNFVDEARAMEFRQRWHGAQMSPLATGLGLEVTAAGLQGFGANVQHLKGKPPGDLAWRCSEPIVIKHGRQVHLDEVLGSRRDLVSGQPLAPSSLSLSLSCL